LPPPLRDRQGSQPRAGPGEQPLLALLGTRRRAGSFPEEAQPRKHRGPRGIAPPWAEEVLGGKEKRVDSPASVAGSSAVPAPWDVHGIRPWPLAPPSREETARRDSHSLHWTARSEGAGGWAPVAPVGRISLSFSDEGLGKQTPFPDHGQWNDGGKNFDDRNLGGFSQEWGAGAGSPIAPFLQWASRQVAT
jgi:hypothetical protein